MIFSLSVATLSLSYASQCPKPSADKVMLAKAKLKDDPVGKTCSLTEICIRNPGDPTM